MNTQQQLLYKVLRNFEGMNKLDVFDLLHKMEVLLFYAKSPLKNKQIKEIIELDTGTDTTIDLFRFTVLPNGYFCEFVGSNDWIYIYKEVRRGIGRLSPLPTYYYKTKYSPLALLRLNNDNLLDSVKSTDQEQAVIAFLNNYSVTAKDQHNGQLSILKIV